MQIEISIPFSPLSVNQAYRSYRGRVIKSKQYMEFQANVQPYIKDCKKLEGDIKITVRIFKKGIRKYDIDNLLKTLLDVLEGTLYDNDHQICEIHITKQLSHENKTVIILNNI